MMTSQHFNTNGDNNERAAKPQATRSPMTKKDSTSHNTTQNGLNSVKKETELSSKFDRDRKIREETANIEDIDAESVRHYGAAVLNLIEKNDGTNANTDADARKLVRRTSMTSSPAAQVFANPELVKRLIYQKALKEAEANAKAGSTEYKYENKHKNSAGAKGNGDSNNRQTTQSKMLKENSSQRVSSASSRLLSDGVCNNNIATGAAAMSSSSNQQRQQQQRQGPPPTQQKLNSLPPSAQPEEEESYIYGTVSRFSNWMERQRAARQQMELQRQAIMQREKLRKIQAMEQLQKRLSASKIKQKSRLKSISGIDLNISYKDLEGDDDVDKPTFSVPQQQQQQPYVKKKTITASSSLEESINERDTLIKSIKIEPEPEPENYDAIPTPFILSKNVMLQMARKALPPSIMLSRWKRLYSLQRDGDAFQGMLQRCSGEDRTLLVVKNMDGKVFGGYVDCVWDGHGHKSSTFYGTGQAFLFRVDQVKKPNSSKSKENNKENQDTEEKLVVYKWKGVNRYIQLCDVEHGRIAMGGGGQNGSFGLCLEDDFSRGSTGPCDTFGNEPLTGNEGSAKSEMLLGSSGPGVETAFDVMDVEVWSFLGFMY